MLEKLTFARAARKDGCKPDQAAPLPLRARFIQYFKSRARLALWLLGVGMVMTYFVCASCHQSLYRYVIVAIFCASIWISMWLGNEFIVEWLDSRIKWTTSPIRRLLAGLTAMVVFTVGILFLLLLVFEVFFDLRINTKVETMYVSLGITFAITVFLTSRSFLLNWRQSAIDAERLQKENFAARYESLKSQVNPHFLFNNFNALSNLVYEDPDKAVKFIKQLSEVYRYVLDTRDREVVSLKEELKFLDAYSYLQKIRFGEKLGIEVTVGNDEFQIAPLALQMLVENAIKHNIVSEEDPLRIKVYSDDGYICVENNLQKRNTIVESSAGVGLENISKRYEFLSERKVEVSEDAARFLVRLPLL